MDAAADSGCGQGPICIKLLPEKNSGYFNQSCFPMVKSMVTNIYMLT